MIITRKTVRDKILGYLNQETTLAQLVDWAENALDEESFDLRDTALLADVIARLGAADVEGFGLPWDDCHTFLSRLGYKVEVVAA
jgi:hypothetical protein